MVAFDVCINETARISDSLEMCSHKEAYEMCLPDVDAEKVRWFLQHLLKKMAVRCVSQNLGNSLVTWSFITLSPAINWTLHLEQQLEISAQFSPFSKHIILSYWMSDT